MEDKVYLTCTEIAPMLGVTPGEVRKRVNTGELPALREQGRIRVPTEAFRRWREQQTRQALANVVATKGPVTRGE